MALKRPEQFTEDEWSDFGDFVTEFREESDRAAVILGAAKLEIVMGQVLRKVLVPVPGTRDEFLEGDVPLGTLSAKIHALYRLGLIDAAFARALHLIRKIRNDFAHEVAGSTLETGSHPDRVKDLIGPIRAFPFVQDFRKHFFEGAQGVAVDFRIVLALQIGRLEALRQSAEPISPPSYQKVFAYERWKNWP